MKSIKPALSVSDPNKEVVAVDLHQEDTLSDTKKTAEAASNNKSAANASTGEVGSSSIFSEENADKAASFIKDNSDDAKSIGNVVSKASSAKTDLGKAQGVSRTINAVEDSMGGTGALSNLTDDQKSYVALAGEAADDTTQSVLIINGVRKEVDKGDQFSVSSITKTLNKLSGDSTFSLLDVGSELAFVGMITAEAMKWGIPELIDSAIERIQDEKERKKEQLNALIKASKGGDVDQVNYWLGKVSGSKYRNIRNDLLYNVLDSYKKPKKETNQVAGSKLLTLLNRLNSGWDAGRTLEPYMFAGKAALEVLQYTDRGKFATTQLQLKFKEEPCSKIIKASFPDLEPDIGEF